MAKLWQLCSGLGGSFAQGMGKRLPYKGKIIVNYLPCTSFPQKLTPHAHHVIAHCLWQDCPHHWLIHASAQLSLFFMYPHINTAQSWTSGRFPIWFMKLLYHFLFLMNFIFLTLFCLCIPVAFISAIILNQIRLWSLLLASPLFQSSVTLLILLKL